MPDREDAWELLCEYTKGDSLRRHALAVEAAMRACAGRYGGDADEWGITGLLHDFDYEMFPDADSHPYKGATIMCGRGYPDHVIRAIMVTRPTRACRATRRWRVRSSPPTSCAASSSPARSSGQTRVLTGWK